MPTDLIVRLSVLLLLTACDGKQKLECDNKKRSDAILVCMYDHYKTDSTDLYRAGSVAVLCQAAANERFCKRAENQ